jgi:hypothetical protein
MATPGLSEILTTTLRARSKNVSSQIDLHDPLLFRLQQKGMKKTFSGGRSIVEELEYQENSSFMRYSGYEPLDISPQEHLTAAEYGIKQCAMSITMSGLEQIQNQGSEAVLDLMESRISNCERSFKNNMVREVWSDGSADGGKQIGGMQHLVSNTGLGTIGGIDANTWNFWRNKVVSIAAVAGGPASATTIQTAMNEIYLSLVINSDHPDLIIFDNKFYNYYLSSLQAIQRISDPKMASAGFQTLKFMGADVVLGNGFNGPAPLNQGYFLNTSYIKYRPVKGRDIAVIGGEREPLNQDGIAKIWGWAGNMTICNRQYQGVLTA